MASNKKITILDIKNSLLEQLEKNGSKTPFFEALVDDYMFYEREERKMKKDVKKRGVTFEAVSAQGKTYDKENPSVKGAIMYNKQKLAILKQLNLTVDSVVLEDDDEDSEL